MVTIGGCASFSSNIINITNVGVEESILEQGFELYPNPSDGNFTLSITINDKTNYSIEIRNVLGQQLYLQKIENVRGKIAKQLTLKEYGKGIYFVTVKGKNIESTKKLLVY